MKSSILRRSLPIVLGAALAASMGQASFAQNVKIGSLSAVTGPIANLVPPIIEAEQLAVKQINEAGGILGGRQLELVVGDTQCNAQASVDAAGKLVNVEQVVAIVGARFDGHDHLDHGCCASLDRVRVPFFPERGRQITTAIDAQKYPGEVRWVRRPLPRQAWVPARWVPGWSVGRLGPQALAEVLFARE